MSILQSRKRGALAAVAVSGLSKAWTAYTPTVTAVAGTITTVSATGAYLIVGKVTFVDISITVTTNGTGSGHLIATLPNTPANNLHTFAGREVALTGKMLQGRVIAATGLRIFYYDGTYPGADGASIAISGIYEAA